MKQGGQTLLSGLDNGIFKPSSSRAVCMCSVDHPSRQFVQFIVVGSFVGSVSLRVVVELNCSADIFQQLKHQAMGVVVHFIQKGTCYK
jgi:hypothetical protein